MEKEPENAGENSLDKGATPAEQSLHSADVLKKYDSLAAVMTDCHKMFMHQQSLFMQTQQTLIEDKKDM